VLAACVYTFCDVTAKLIKDPEAVTFVGISLAQISEISRVLFSSAAKLEGELLSGTTTSPEGATTPRICPSSANSNGRWRRATRSQVVLLLARLMGRYCFACCRLSALSVVVCNAHGRSAAAAQDAWPVRRPTLHCGTVRLRPDRATPCFISTSSRHLVYLLPVATGYWKNGSVE